MSQRLVLIGNGFDLAHGLKTSYRDFIDWYMSRSFERFIESGTFADRLINFERRFAGVSLRCDVMPKKFTEVLDLFQGNEHCKLEYKSRFYKLLIDLFEKGWVDIERQYFQQLKKVFSLNTISKDEKAKNVLELNADFDHIIFLLTDYINFINSAINRYQPLNLGSPKLNFYKAFQVDDACPVTFVNFNYTDTLSHFGYADEKEIIHIHGRASAISENPIIFGYGDESDPVYQQIEDSGDNVYLEHIKSFAYFKNGNYQRLIDLLDSDVFEVYIFGHSCGLSDRILLNEIFEHKNCQQIEIFYYKRSDGTDNFKEITQEISRHFKPQKKGMMRRRVKPQDSKNIIPQPMP